MQLGRSSESLPHWKRLFELADPPIRAEHRLRYATALIEAGEHARAATEAQAIVEMTKGSAEMLYNAACLYALCSRLVRRDERMPSLLPLHAREDFQKFLKRLAERPF